MITAEENRGFRELAAGALPGLARPSSPGRDLVQGTEDRGPRTDGSPLAGRGPDGPTEKRGPVSKASLRVGREP